MHGTAPRLLAILRMAPPHQLALGAALGRTWCTAACRPRSLCTRPSTSPPKGDGRWLLHTEAFGLLRATR